MPTLDGICQSGSFPSAYVFHITGMPWAATNSPQLKSILDDGYGVAAYGTAPYGGGGPLKRLMFGIVDALETPADVQILTILDNDLGSQSVKYGPDKGIEVGPWSVRLNADNTSGFVYTNGGSFSASGILGLTWAPTGDTSGSAWSALDVDWTPTTTGTIPSGTLQWPWERDFGLKSWLDDNWGGSSYTNDCDIYINSSVLRPFNEVQTDSTNRRYYVGCYGGIYNTPNERIPSRRNEQTIDMQNFPQSINGMNANLWAYQVNKDGRLISGQLPFMLRSGKVKPGTRDGGNGVWTVNVGGVTDSLKVRAVVEPFDAHVSGYYFNDINEDGAFNTSIGRVDQYLATPHISVREVIGGTNDNFAVLYLTGVGVDYVEFDTIGEILDATVDALNASSDLACTYKRDGDSITYAPGASGVNAVGVTGIVPFICGVGYINADKLPRLIHEQLLQQQRELRPYNPSDAGNPFRMVPQNEYDSTGAQVWYVQATDGYNFAELQESDVTGNGAIVWDKEVVRLLRNPCTSPYFIQYDLSDNTTLEDQYDRRQALKENHSKKWPQDSSGNRRVHYTTDSNVVLNDGAQIAFGPVIESYGQSRGKIDTVTGASNYFTLDNNTVLGMPYAMFWPKGLQDALQFNEQWVESLELLIPPEDAPIRWDYTEKLTSVPRVADQIVANYSMEDPFAIGDVTKIKTTSPVDILKDIMGDKDVTSTGISDSIKLTDMQHFVDRNEYINKGFIQWTSLQNIVDSALLDDCAYTLDVRDPQGGESIDVFDFDIMSLLTGICVTHEAKMVWEWNEGTRSWRINFVKDGADSAANAVTHGRRIAQGAQVAGTPLTGMEGGDWYYATIKAEYGRTDGGSETFNIKNRDGRVRHTLGDKTMTVNDTMTLLPSGSTNAREQLIKRFSTYQQRWSTIQYKHSMNTTLGPYARVPVGMYSVMDSISILDRDTGQRNVGDVLGMIQGATYNLGAAPAVTYEFITDPRERTGISPTIYISDIDHSLLQTNNIISVSGLATNPALNDFADPNDSALTDLAMFGCIDNIDGTLTERDCSCGQYRITMFERGTSKLYFDSAYLDANQNVWRGYIRVLVSDATNGQCLLTLDDDNQLNVTGKEFVVIFADRADANLQQCQIDLYGWLGQSTSTGNGKVQDSAGSEHPAIKVG
jgi:hypothetical protein